MVNGAYTVSLGTDSKLTVPGNIQVDGGKIILNTGGNAYVESVNYGVNTTTSAVNIFGGPYQKIKLRAGFGTEASWIFGTDGSLTFPNATVQTTAWTGTVAYSNITNVPSVSTSTLVSGTSTVTLSSTGKLTLSTAGIVRSGTDTAQVGYQAVFTQDLYGNTSTGQVSGMTVVDVSSNAQLLALIDVNSLFGNNQYNLLSPITITYSDATTQTFTELRSTNIGSGSIAQFGYNATTIGHNFPITVTAANYVAATTAPEWTFGSNGSLTFPNATVQTTAWTGTVAYSNITGAPAAFNTATLVANAVNAVTVSGAAQPNITSVGTLTSLIVSGEIVAQKLTIELTTVTTTLIKTDDIIQTTNTTVSTSTNTGALTVAGGVGVGGNLYVGGVISLPNGATLKDSSNTALAFGQGAGAGVQGLGSVAIGLNSGNVAQGYYSVAVGIGAGWNNQADGAVAVGRQSGNANQGTNAVAIGGYAGETTQSTGTIIINASGSATNGVSGQQNSLYIRPIRSATTTSGVLQYNPTTYEVTYSTTITATASAGTTSTTAAALGYIGMPQNSTASSYTLVAGDQGKHIYISATGQTITIPANTAVAFPIGTSIAFIAGPSATTVTIAITTDTMRLAGAGTTGTRTLAAHGMATAVKVASTDWYINGVGLT